MNRVDKSEWPEYRYKGKKAEARKHCMFEPSGQYSLDNRVWRWVWGEWDDGETGQDELES